ncbi:MAG: hypothetical protein ACPGLV_03750 [Bacteroidia bacterium]
MEFASKESKMFAIIKALIKSDKVEVLEKVEKLLRKEGVFIDDDADNEPMTIEELKAGINQSINDYEQGRFVSNEEFGEIIKGWSLG